MSLEWKNTRPQAIGSVEIKNTNKVVNNSKDKANEVLDKNYSIFWNPDQNQKEMIDSWDEKFRNRMKWILSFQKETITLSFKKYDLYNCAKGEYIFYKNQPIFKYDPWDDWYDMIKKIEKFWWKTLWYKEISSILKFIDLKYEILNLEKTTYYSNTTKWCDHAYWITINWTRILLIKNKYKYNFFLLKNVNY